MRLSREELLNTYPGGASWNEKRHDIVKTLYGNTPLTHWDKEEYDRFLTYTGTLSNIFAIDAYIWCMNGDYDIFRTLIGSVYISAKGDILTGNINVKFGGQIYNMHLNLMYGKKGLDIQSISYSGVRGFSNKDGAGSPTIKANTFELSPERIERILAIDLSDYGNSVKEYMKKVGEIYSENKENFIREKTFGD